MLSQGTNLRANWGNLPVGVERRRKTATDVAQGSFCTKTARTEIANTFRGGGRVKIDGSQGRERKKGQVVQVQE